VSPTISTHPKSALIFQLAKQTPARFQSLVRQFFVNRTAARIVPILILAATATIPALIAGSDLDPTLHAIENRYNHAQTLKLDFSESYLAFRRPTQTETGVLYLRKPGRMRWDYATPPGKFFLADGKDTFSYSPDENRVQKAPLKMSDDDRAPLAFLLGHLDFHKDFQSFENHIENNETWIVAHPKSQNLPYKQVDFLATPEGQIRKVRVTDQTDAKLEFTFSNEQLNPQIAPNMFVFKQPAGAAVVNIGAEAAQ
jgi:outer membrane lipoprotein carrier protein